MEVKLFEIRDSATFIPCIATRFAQPVTERERYLLSRDGYCLENESVLFGRLSGEQTPYDPYNHGMARTLPIAHSHIVENWGKLTSGDVIDVQFILGETESPKVSEQMGYLESR